MRAARERFYRGPCACARHNALCPLLEADGDLCGTPCQPWSAAGLRRGQQSQFCTPLDAANLIIFQSSSLEALCQLGPSQVCPNELKKSWASKWRVIMLLLSTRRFITPSADRNSAPFVKIDAKSGVLPCAGVEDRRTAALLLWLLYVEAVQPTWAIHENVHRFHRSLINDALQQWYWVWHLEVSPSDVGFGLIKRARVYTVLIKRTETLLRDVGALHSAVLQGFHRHAPKPRALSCMCSDAAALLTAENAARLRAGLPEVSVVSGSWEYLLTPAQQEYLAKYMALWALAKHRDPCCDPDAIFDLSQNPARRPCQSSGGALPCLRTGSCFWACSRKRWLLRLELMLAMGMPATCEAATAAHVSQETERHGAKELGNAMHCFNVGVVLGCTLASMENKQVPLQLLSSSFFRLSLC